VVATPPLISFRNLPFQPLQHGDMFTYDMIGRLCLYVNTKFAGEVWQNSDVLDQASATNEIINKELIFGPDILTDRYHVRLIRSHLNVKLDDVTPLLLEEFQAGFDEELGHLKVGEEFVVKDLQTFVKKLIARSNAKIVVGEVRAIRLPILCYLLMSM
jgi:hypothetical protein